MQGRELHDPVLPVSRQEPRAAAEPRNLTFLPDGPDSVPRVSGAVLGI
jgi:hypothetical protein